MTVRNLLRDLPYVADVWMAMNMYISMRFGGPRPSEPHSPGPESTLKGRERGLPAIPNNSWIDTTSKNDQSK